MSSNSVHTCYRCESTIRGFIKGKYGRVSEEDYLKIKEAEKVDEILPYLPDELKNGDTDRIEGSDLDYEFVEDWGEGISVNPDGNLEVSISCQCDLCGIEFHYDILLPPNSINKRIDMTNKGEGK